MLLYISAMKRRPFFFKHNIYTNLTHTNYWLPPTLLVFYIRGGAGGVSFLSLFSYSYSQWPYIPTYVVLLVRLSNFHNKNTSDLSKSQFVTVSHTYNTCVPLTGWSSEQPFKSNLTTPPDRAPNGMISSTIFIVIFDQ